MNTEKKDIATLIELLKMETERWPHSETHEVSQSELLRRDHSLLEMWPEACRRTGVGKREQDRSTPQSTPAGDLGIRNSRR
jgi:predicted Zn-ribbon and HTH transcriptional regulator